MHRPPTRPPVDWVRLTAQLAAMEGLHPHWFMMWLVEAGVPAYIAAGLSFYAVKTALKIADGNRLADREKRDAERREKRLIVIEAFVEIFDTFTAIRDIHSEQAGGFAVETLHQAVDNLQGALDYAASQHVADARVLTLTFRIRISIGALRGRLRAHSSTVPRAAMATSLETICAKNGTVTAVAELLDALELEFGFPANQLAERKKWRRTAMHSPASETAQSPQQTEGPEPG